MRHDNADQSKGAERLAWTVADAAKALGISESMLRAEIARQKVATTRIGRRLLIPDNELRKFVDARTRTAKCTHAVDES